MRSGRRSRTERSAAGPSLGWRRIPTITAAAKQGLRTGDVARPLEWGPKGKPHAVADSTFDVSAGDFNQLAERLGA